MSLLDFSPEIIENILDFIPQNDVSIYFVSKYFFDFYLKKNKKNLGRFAIEAELTSRFWFTFTWHTCVAIDVNDVTDNLLNEISNLTFVKCLYINGIKYTATSITPLRKMIKLIYLNLTSPNDNIDISGINEIPNLRFFSSNSDVSINQPLTSQLTEIKFLKEIELDKLNDILPMLQQSSLNRIHVNIDTTHRCTDFHLKNPFNALKQISTLSEVSLMYQCTNTDMFQNDMIDSLSQMTSLRSLGIHTYFTDSTTVIEYFNNINLLKNLTNLESLTFNAPIKKDDAVDVCNSLSKLTHLEMLRITENEPIELDMPNLNSLTIWNIKGLEKMSRLRVLILLESNDNSVIENIHMISTLRYLDINCNRLSLESISLLSVESLTLRSDKPISKAFITQLTKMAKLKNLTVYSQHNTVDDFNCFNNVFVIVYN